MLLVGGTSDALAIVLPGIGIESLIAAVVEGASVEFVGAGFCFHFDSAGTVFAVLRAVVGSQDFEFRDGFQVWIDIQRIVATVIHVVAAVDFPIVVLGAAAIDAVQRVADDADRAFVLSRLIYDTGERVTS